MIVWRGMSAFASVKCARRVEPVSPSSSTATPCRWLRDFISVIVLLWLVQLCRTAGASAPTHQDITDFNAWLAAHARRTPSIAVVATEDMGLGVAVTTDRVRRHSVTLELPLSSTLCREGLAMSAQYYPLIASESEEDLIVLALLVEHALGNLSNFSAWLKVMPSPPDIRPPFVWSDEELQRIEPRSVQRTARQLRQRLAERYDALRFSAIWRRLQRFVSDVWAASAVGGVALERHPTAPRDAWLQERYAWAKALVDSRAWNLQGSKYLVPGADFFNHAPDAQDVAYHFSQHTPERSQKFVEFHQVVLLPSDPEGSRKSTTARFARVLSDRDGGRVGSQLFESYGDNGNDIYFTYHGFVPINNSRDCQPIQLSRGVAQLTRRDASLEALLRGISGLRCCVHLNEHSPMLQLFGWLHTVQSVVAARLPTVAAGFASCVRRSTKPSLSDSLAGLLAYRTAEKALRAVQACVKSMVLQAPPAQPQEAREEVTSEDERTALLQDYSAKPQLRRELALKLVNASFRAQHDIVFANAKEEFSTLRCHDQRRVDVGSPSVDAAELLVHRLRSGRCEILKALLQMLRDGNQRLLSRVSAEWRFEEPSESQKQDEL